MKYITLLLLSTMLAAACRKPEGPIPVAKQFLDALQKKDYKAAAALGTPETVKLLRQFEKIELLNGALDKEAPAKIEILSEDIRGKSAIVYFREEGNPLEQKISLVRTTENGKQVWRVNLKKEEIRLMQGQQTLPAPI